MTSDPLLRKWYAYYNRKWFGGKLPKGRAVVIYWDALDNTYGEVTDELVPGKIVIRINTMLSGWHELWKWVLLHEMGHLAVWPDERHGKSFHKEMRRLMNAGAYRKLI